jgi:hypothetical protein
MTSGRLDGARLRLTGVALIVLTLLCVPTLVRATQSLSRDSASIRLNRGFCAPESKARVEPPVAQAFFATILVTIPGPRAVLAARAVTPPLLLAQRDVSPPVLRGPPPASSLS